MRALVVIALLATACGGKQDQSSASQHKAAVDRYANADMQRNWAVLWTGKRPFKKLPADAVDAGNADWVQTAMSEHVIPRMREFIDAAEKVTVPPPMVNAHNMIISVAEDYLVEGKDMLDAAKANDSAKFKEAHGRMLATSAREGRWRLAFDKVLSDAGVVFAEVPQLAEPAPPTLDPNATAASADAQPKPHTYCGDAPCPCARGESPAARGECTLTAPVEIRGMKCTRGKIQFRADGTLKSCMLLGDENFLAGEATFHSNGNIASAISNTRARFPSASCGVGPARWFEDGTYEACTLAGETSAANIPVPKGVSVFVVFHPGGRVRYMKFGKEERCLDLAEVPYTPCIAPVW